MSRLLLLLAVAALAGCAATPKPAQVDFAEPRLAQASTLPAMRPATGSLFQNTSYRASFEDRRARQVGDTVTIRIVENVTASQKSSSTANRSSSIDGSITATVAEVLPNGHLLVTGEKQIGLNHNVDVLRFTGTVDPLAILPGNLINSNQVSNVRVESKGRGPQYEAQTVGWLTRFFFNLSPF